MTPSPFLRAARPALLLLCVQAGPARSAPPAVDRAGAMPAGMDAGTGAAGQAAAPVDREMMAGMGEMDRDMARAPMTGDPDRDFAAMMLPHHRGAVAMARTELRYGRDPAMRALATDIVAAQEREIALMRRWLAAHPAAAPAPR